MYYSIINYSRHAGCYIPKTFKNSYFLLELWCCAGFSPVVVGGGQSLVAERGLSRTGSIVVELRLSCSAAHEIFLDQGSNPCLLHWQVDSLPPGKPPVTFYGNLYLLTPSPTAHSPTSVTISLFSVSMSFVSVCILRIPHVSEILQYSSLSDLFHLA